MKNLLLIILTLTISAGTSFGQCKYAKQKRITQDPCRLCGRSSADVMTKPRILFDKVSVFYSAGFVCISSFVRSGDDYFLRLHNESSTTKSYANSTRDPLMLYLSNGEVMELFPRCGSGGKYGGGVYLNCCFYSITKEQIGLLTKHRIEEALIYFNTSSNFKRNGLVENDDGRSYFSLTINGKKQSSCMKSATCILSSN